jgi:hypothetical protein
LFGAGEQLCYNKGGQQFTNFVKKPSQNCVRQKGDFQQALHGTPPNVTLQDTKFIRPVFVRAGRGFLGEGMGVGSVLQGVRENYVMSRLTFMEPCVVYIGRAYRYPPNTPFFIFFQQIYVLNILNMLHTLLFFSSKCRLFHNAIFFCACIIRVLHTGCAKI